MLTFQMEDHRPALITDGVHESDQSMPSDRSFWAFFTANLVLSTWVVGVLVIGLGMNFWWGLFVVLAGNAVGSLGPALLGVMGPKTRLTQMESSRASFGKIGTRIPSFINWLNCIGWDAVSNVPSAAAFAGFFALIGMHVPFWLCLSVLASVQVLIVFYGHHMVQSVQRSLGYALLITFAITGIIVVKHMGIVIDTGKSITLSAFMITIGIVISNVAAWAAPYASDYTRYLPKIISSKAVFWRVFMGLFLSTVTLEFLGLLTASAVAEQTPQGLIGAITTNTGAFAPLALLVITVSCIPPNAMGDNTGAYSLISAGVPIPRHFSAVVSKVIAFALALWGAAQFMDLLVKFLLLILYWVFPWMAIVLVDWAMSDKLSFKFYEGWSIGATMWCTIALFPAAELYTGPIAKMLGGVDIGYYVGFLMASVSYWAAIKYMPNLARVSPFSEGD
jgi:NCS1 family nucleobase:cation symporter-1